MATTSAPRMSASPTSAKQERRGYAGFLEYAAVALDSLRANKLRSFLTLLGITIGITSIISVISLIQGMDQYWKTKVSNFGPNTFVVTQYPIITNFDKFIEAVRRNPEVHAADAERLRRACTACEAIGVETHRNVRVHYGKQSIDTIELGVMTPNIFDIEGKKVDAGRNFIEWEDEHSRTVTVIGADIADKLFPGLDPIGKEVQIDDKWYMVVGIGERRGSVFGFSQDNYVKVPLSTYPKNYGARRTVNISVKAREGEMQEAEDQVRLTMRTLHKLDYHEDDDFGVITAEGVNQLFAMLTTNT